METMKALVKTAPEAGNLEIREVAVPKAQTGQVVIKIEVAGICGSDLHIYHSDIAIPVRPPVIIGHEFSGVVCEVGEGVTSCKPGDRVVSETAYSYCMECDHCKVGYYNLCNNRRTLGYWYNGVFTSYTVVPAGRVHHLPEEVDFTSGAMIEPLACVVHAVEDLTVLRPGDVAVVLGPGAIGLMTAQVAMAYGATVVVSCVNGDEYRMELAQRLGISHVVNSQKEDLSALVGALTAGVGADAVYECSGNERAVNQGLELCRKRGWYVQIGLGGKPVTFNIETVCYKEIHFSGSLGSRFTSWNQAIRLVAQKKVNLLPLATHRFSITQWEEAFRLFEEKNCGKIMLEPAE